MQGRPRLGWSFTTARLRRFEPRPPVTSSAHPRFEHRPSHPGRPSLSISGNLRSRSLGARGRPRLRVPDLEHRVATHPIVAVAETDPFHRHVPAETSLTSQIVAWCSSRLTRRNEPFPGSALVRRGDGGMLLCRRSDSPATRIGGTKAKVSLASGGSLPEWRCPRRGRRC